MSSINWYGSALPRLGRIRSPPAEICELLLLLLLLLL
jgi:hypothetical protein